MTSYERCDWWLDDHEKCEGLAVYWLSATWTMLDFGDWYACQQHVDVLESALWRRTVDGQPCDSVYVHPYPVTGYAI